LIFGKKKGGECTMSLSGPSPEYFAYENAGQAMRTHGGNDAGVVGYPALALMGYDQRFPSMTFSRRLRSIHHHSTALLEFRAAPKGHSPRAEFNQFEFCRWHRSKKESNFRS
jgi:hypothetical protein